MVGLALVQFNEFQAGYEQFVDLQKRNFLNARNWVNLGATFLCKLVAHSHSEKQDSSSQLNSKSIYNSNRSAVINKQSSEDEQQAPLSKLVFRPGRAKRNEAEVLLAEISKSPKYVDFVMEKENQDQTKLAISCLKR